MPICDDQDWDTSVPLFEDGFGVGEPRLLVSEHAPSTGIPAFRRMAITTDQVAPPPNCTTHQTVARASPTGGLVCMPTDATSGVAATGPEETFLFEAYVQAFCAMDVP